MIAAGRVLAPTRMGRWLLCVAGLVIALVVGALQHRDHIAKRTSSRAPVDTPKPVEGRKIYPLSVIAGGAYSAEELNRARRLDAVVKAHYAGFSSNPVVQQTPKDLFVYVSYRKSDAVYWTATKRRVPKGELVLSDGKNLARARCGNRLSFTPQQPAGRGKEPAEEALNTPEVPEISMPLDAPLPLAADADLYVPANPLPMDLLSRLTPSSPFAVFGPPGLSPQANGGYAPVPGWGAGPLGGGIPLGRTGNGSPVRTNTNSGTSPAAPAIVGGLVGVSTPEPGSAKLLLLAVLILLLFCLRGRIHLSL
jgi:hypothetical protein